MEVYIKLEEFEYVLGNPFRGIEAVANHPHLLVGKEGDIVSLEIELKLSDRGNESEDRLFQSCISGFGIM